MDALWLLVTYLKCHLRYTPKLANSFTAKL